MPEWSDPGDPRHAITLRQLLAMRDGLDFVEDYVDDRVSDVIQMLFGDGQSDMAHFAADRPLAAPPGHPLQLLVGDLEHHLGHRGPHRGAGRELRPLPARPTLRAHRHASADPEFDEAGTWVASSYLRATAQDFARFGLLYLRDGMWDGVRILPTGWVDYGRTWVSVDPDGRQTPTARTGTAWRATPSAPSAPRATRGSRSPSAPPLDLIVVRLGKTPLERKTNLVPWRKAMVQAFADAR